jgi:hypothetical protein
MANATTLACIAEIAIRRMLFKVLKAPRLKQSQIVKPGEHHEL